MKREKQRMIDQVMIALGFALLAFCFITAAFLFRTEPAFAEQDEGQETYDALDTMTFFYQGTTDGVVEFNIYNDVYDPAGASLIPQNYPVGNPYVNDQKSALNNCDLAEYFYLNGERVRDILDKNEQNITSCRHPSMAPLNRGGVFAPVCIQVLTYESRINVKVMLDEAGSFTFAVMPGFEWVNEDGQIIALSEEIAYKYQDGKLIKQFAKEETAEIAACTGNSGNSVQVRTGNTGMDAEGNITGWYGDRYLFFFLPTDVYNTYMPASEWRNNYRRANDLSGYNILDYIELDTWEGDTLKLGDIVNVSDIEYDKFGEHSAITFNIGAADDSNPYGGTSFSAIRILKGCEFPDFKSTNGPGNVLKKYVQISTIQITYEHVIGVVPNFNTNWSVDPELGFTAEVSDIAYGGNDNYLTLWLNNVADYPQSDVQTSCGMESEYYFDKYVYINGISLYELARQADEQKTSLMGCQNGSAFLAVPVPSYTDSSDITEIIVREGCRIPAYDNNEQGAAAYGENYYSVRDTVTFIKNADGTFEVKDGDPVWTITFDGENPVRVEDYDRLRAEDIPDGPEKEGYRFIGWYDGILRLSANAQVTEGLNYTSKYIKVNTVTLDYGNGKTEKVLVDQNTKMDVPSGGRLGYNVVAWQTEDGEIFNFEKNIRSDMTLYAVCERTAVWYFLVIGVPVIVVAVAACLTVCIVLKHKKRAHSKE